jgi:hypothetical protein
MEKLTSLRREKMNASAQPGNIQQASSPAPKRPPRLSPDLSEFLHMLNALEDHFEAESSDDQ